MENKQKTTRIFKGKGFRVNAFPNEAEKKEAIRQFAGRIRHLQPEWKLVTQNENNALMIDKDKNVKTIMLAWGFLDGGPRLVETTADVNSIKFVRIEMLPPGIPRTRDAGEAIFNPYNKGNVWIFVDFVTKGFTNIDLHYDVLRMKKIPINIQNLEYLAAMAQKEIILIRSFFSDKIKSDDSTGPFY